MYPATVCRFFKNSSLASFVIANGGTVSLNAPLGLVISHLNFWQELQVLQYQD